MYIQNMPIYILLQIVFSMLFFLPNFIIAKSLIGWKKLQWSESVFVFLSCFFIAAVSLLLNWSIGDATLLFLSSALLLTLLLCIYFFHFIGTSLQLSFSLTIISIGIFVFLETLLFSLWVHLFNFNHLIVELVPTQRISYLIALYAITTFALFIIPKVKRRIPTNMLLTEKSEPVAAVALALVFILFIFITSLQYHEGADLSFLSWPSAFIFIYTIATGVSFVFYAKAMHEKQKMREKEIEHRSLLQYIDHSKGQQDALQKIHHDFQNILASLETFIAEENFVGLSAYYRAKIKPASEIILQSNIALRGLNNIKPHEIRGILTAKLSMAQNLGIDVRFEAPSEIEHIPTDSIVLVRMLGILLDNAIEALSGIENGKLKVGFLKVGDSINFIISNTCPADMPSIRGLNKRGFSTKGEGRGMGLHILAELTESLPNVTRSTEIEGGNFIQILVIGGTA